jgi:hypothetical protein
MMLLSTDRLLIQVHRLAAADIEMNHNPAAAQFSKTKLREETENVYRANDYVEAKDRPFAALLAKAPANSVRGSAFFSVPANQPPCFDIGLSPQTAAIH